MKGFLRNILQSLRLDLTKNLKYDRLTIQVLKKVIHADSNCIDIGCHKGEILNKIVEFAPQGKHMAFEPIPTLFNLLKNKYNESVQIFPFALSDENGNSKFHYVKNAPAYSGINKRDYKVKPKISLIDVEIKRLDEFTSEKKIDFIKIDVEGGEFEVLKGAEKTLSNNNPIILFECGLGASNHYGTIPEEFFCFFEKLGYCIFLLENFLADKGPLTKLNFVEIYNQNKDYYFVAQKEKLC